MTRRFINQLADADDVSEVFLASGKQLRPNRNGNLYLQVQLSDRTGSVNAMMWNANDRVYRSFNNGDYVQVEGAAQIYNGSLQIIASQIRTADAGQLNDGDFQTLTGGDIDSLLARLKEIVQSVRNHHLRNLADCFLMNEAWMDKFTCAPAGIKLHHAYRGGLLQHVVALMELAQFVGARYPEINGDLLAIGALLHDVGKIDELAYQRDMSYTDLGQLIGHAVIGVGIVDQLVQQAEELSGEQIPEQLVLQIKHMIVSHHGTLEFGSPKVPMTLEAVALHYLDSLDSKINSFGQLIRDDPNSDSGWTAYHSNISRKLFKGQRGEGESSE